MKIITQCVYDNPRTMQREAWERYGDTFTLIKSYSVDMVVQHRRRRRLPYQWEDGQIIGDAETVPEKERMK